MKPFQEEDNSCFDINLLLDHLGFVFYIDIISLGGQSFYFYRLKVEFFGGCTYGV